MTSVIDNNNNNIPGAVNKKKVSQRKKYTNQLVKGGEFTKFHLMGAVRKQRRLWCSKDLKKIYWGSAKDTKRGNIKGYASTRDLVSVSETVDTLMLCLKFTKKKIELKAAGLDELDKWVRLYNWLLKNAKRGGFNARGSVMKRSSWAVTSLTNDIASTYEIIIRLLKGSNATVYVKSEEPRNVYIWISFLLNEICYGVDITARGEMKKGTKGISIKDIMKFQVGQKKRFLEDSINDDSDTLSRNSETIVSINPMNNTSVSMTLKDETFVEFAFSDKRMMDCWIAGVDYICTMSQLEKEDFYWYYCSLKEESIRCARGCNNMDDSLLTVS